ncbi:hypothetical protein JXA85_02165 [Candidatus Woesearchaeota archaeon]|nr:hypothetical protein [Candidatus Woesearchaeota archaeon]
MFVGKGNDGVGGGIAYDITNVPNDEVSHQYLRRVSRELIYGTDKGWNWRENLKPDIARQTADKLRPEFEKIKKVFFAQAFDGVPLSVVSKNETDLDEIVEKAGGVLIGKKRHIYDAEFKTADDKFERDFHELSEADVMYVDMSVANRPYPGCDFELIKAKEKGTPVVLYVGETGNEKRTAYQYVTKNIFTSREESIKCLRRLCNAT